MLSLVALFFVGKAFYNLAGEYKKPKWGFGVLGVVACWIFLQISAVIMSLIILQVNPSLVDTMSGIVWTLISVPIAALMTWGLYVLLKRNWQQKSLYQQETTDILDAEL